MRKAVLVLDTQLGHGATIPCHDEQRVVPVPVRAARHARDLATHLALERLNATLRPGHGDEAHEAGLPRIATLPRPMHDSKNYDFSFSGLKTAVRNAVHEKTLSKDDVRAYAREIEDAIVEVLVKKTARAAEEFGVHSVILGGGVSANEHLRSELSKTLQITPLLVPAPNLSTDNAIMIALAGYFHANKNEFAGNEKLIARGNASLAHG